MSNPKKEHQWKRHFGMTVCDVCGYIKGSGKDKASMCSGISARDVAALLEKKR